MQKKMGGLDRVCVCGCTSCRHILRNDVDQTTSDDIWFKQRFLRLHCSMVFYSGQGVHLFSVDIHIAIRPESHNVTLHSGVRLSSLQF